MFRLEGGRPNDRRGFVHKSIVGKFVGGLVAKVASRTPLGTVITTGLGFARGLGRARSNAPAVIAKFSGLEGLSLHDQPTHHGPGGLCRHGESAAACALRIARGVVPGGGNGGGPCNPDESQRCCQLRRGSISDQAEWQRSCGTAGVGAGGVGAAVMGQYGAALEPGTMVINRAICLPGMQLAKDGLCYNKGAITNSQRMWPRGRRPLLTGGDMRAISIAARAGSKLDRTTKRLRSLGMMKALPKRTVRTHRHARAATDVVSVN